MGRRGHETGLADMQTGMSLMNSQQQGIYMPLLMAVLAETEAEAGAVPKPL